MRKPHIMKPSGKGTNHPEHIVVFDVETRPATCTPNTKCKACERIQSDNMTEDDEIQQLVLGIALSDDGEMCRFTDNDVFWNWVTNRGSLWLINHNIAFDLMVLDWDHAMTSRGWVADKVIIPEPNGPFSVTWTKGPHFIRMVNLANWWGMRSLASIGKIVGEEKTEVDLVQLRHVTPSDPQWSTLEDYCIQDCQVVLKAVHMWITFCKDHDLGQFAVTQAGQSLNAFQHRFMPTPIYLHTNRRALEFERESYLGARTEVFRLGEMEGSFHVLDVNSLYPYVMKKWTYPTKLRGVVKNVTPAEYHQIREDYLCVGKVLVDIPKGDEGRRVVPVRHDGKLIYPVGRFYTTLTSSELDLAMDRGIVRELHDVCVYDQHHLFADYVDHFYSLRLQYRSAGNNVWYEIVKVFLNSLYGKFGQYNHDWLPCQDDIGIAAGSILKIIDADTDTTTTYRHIGGTLAKRSPGRVEGWNSFAAIASHVTAYARCWISYLRRIAGYKHVFYCDTDSLFVDDWGKANLEEYTNPDKLGLLKLETSANTLTIRGLKDYEIGNKIKHKGIRKDAIPTGENTYRQTQFRGIAGALRQGESGIARVRNVTKTMSRTYTKGTVGEDGWVEPIMLTC